MRKLFHFWPVYVLVVVYGLSWYNLDYFGVPTLFKLGLKKNSVLVVAGTWGFVDMLVAYICWSRFRDLVGEIFQEDLAFMKKVAGESEARGLTEKFKVYIARKHFKINDKADSTVANGPQSLLHKINHKILIVTIKVLKGGSYVLIFLVGFLPIPGIRMFADIICGTARLRKEFMIIALGNLIKTACFVYGWKYLFFKNHSY